MTRRGLLLFVAMCVIWGIPYLFIRIAVSELTPATLVFLRTAVAAAALVPIVARRCAHAHRDSPRLLSRAVRQVAAPRGVCTHRDRYPVAVDLDGRTAHLE